MVANEGRHKEPRDKEDHQPQDERHKPIPEKRPVNGTESLCGNRVEIPRREEIRRVPHAAPEQHGTHAAHNRVKNREMAEPRPHLVFKLVEEVNNAFHTYD